MNPLPKPETKPFSCGEIERLRQQGCGLINCRSRLRKWHLFDDDPNNGMPQRSMAVKSL